MNRTVPLLALSQALAMTVISLMLSPSAQVSVDLAATPGWATLPLAAQYLATLLALHRRVAPSLSAWRQGGGRSIRGWLAGLDHQECQFAVPFTNANTLDDLARLAAQQGDCA